MTKFKLTLCFLFTFYFTQAQIIQDPTIPKIDYDQRTKMDTMKMVYQHIHDTGSLETRLGYIVRYSFYFVETDPFIAGEQEIHLLNIDPRPPYNTFWDLAWNELSEYFIFHYKEFDWKK